MNNKALIAIVVVIIVIVAAVGAVLLVSNDDSKDSENPLSCKLRVLGNANQDNYLNEDDVTYIQNIISGDIHWDRSSNPLADANNDGIIDNNDVTLVRGFLNGTSSTMYYLDWNNSISSIQYPLSTYLGDSYGIYTEFSTGLDMGIILGIYDKFTYMANGDIGPGDLDTAMYKNTSNITEVGIKNPDLESMYSHNVRVLMGDPKFLGSYVSTAESAGFTVIKLPENRTINGVSCLDTMITLGVMFNLQDKTSSFISFMDKVNAKIASAVEDSGVTPLSYIIPYTAPGYLPAIYVDAHGSGSMTTADVTLLEMLPVKSCITTTAADGFDEVTADQLVALHPDIFVVSMFGYSSGKDYTYAQYVDTFKNFVELGFNKGTAKIFGMPFENCSLAGMASILVLASMIWPDSFDADEAWDTMYEYYHTFTNYSGSLEDLKESKFAPLSYSELTA